MLHVAPIIILTPNYY